MNNKTTLIKTSKAQMLLWDAPEGAFDIELQNSTLYWRTGMMENHCHEFADIYGDWKPAGYLDEIPEEVATWLVDSIPYLLSDGDMFKNYTYERGGSYHHNPFEFEVATESLRSLLIANGVKLENPLGDKPPKAICMIGGMELMVAGSMAQNVSSLMLGKWRAAEAEVYRNPYLIYQLKK